VQRFLLTLFFLVAITGVSNAATVITFDGIDPIPTNGLTTNVSGAIVDDFNNGTIMAAWTGTGNYHIVAGSVGAQYAQPFDDFSKYLSVPKDASSGDLKIDFGSSYHYLGLYWGSIDEYNTIAFYNGTNLIESYSGLTLPDPSTPDGNHSSATSNLYVNFFNVNAGLGGFDNIHLISTSMAFEVDNLAVGNPVPIPSSIVLLGFGLVGLVGFRRKRK